MIWRIKPEFHCVSISVNSNHICTYIFKEKPRFIIACSDFEKPAKCPSVVQRYISCSSLYLCGFLNPQSLSLSLSLLHCVSFLRSVSAQSRALSRHPSFVRVNRRLPVWVMLTSSMRLLYVCMCRSKMLEQWTRLLLASQPDLTVICVCVCEWLLTPMTLRASMANLMLHRYNHFIIIYAVDRKVNTSLL